MTRESNEVGEQNEKRVLDVLKWDSPPWMVSARRATEMEDAMGIDIVVLMDVGHILIQVKSSKRGAEVWNQERIERQMRTDIIVVVVNRMMTDDLLADRLRLLLRDARAMCLHNQKRARAR